MTRPAAFSEGQRAYIAGLDPDALDCAIAVMLKILDGKCKMPPDEAAVMAALYDHVRDRPAARLGAAEHALISAARAEPGPRFRPAVYEARVLAETRISRPVMKAFKAGLRRAGILPSRGAEAA